MPDLAVVTFGPGMTPLKSSTTVLGVGLQGEVMTVVVAAARVAKRTPEMPTPALSAKHQSLREPATIVGRIV
jgi:hypothetical protein